MIIDNKAHSELVSDYVSDFLSDMGDHFKAEEAQEWFEGVFEEEETVWAIKAACLAEYERFEIAGFISYDKI